MPGDIIIVENEEGEAMEIRVLKYFLMIVRTENITKAAEALHITQPTLSRQIAQLEEEIGAPLFYRGSRRLRLTPEGAMLKSRAEEIVDLSDKTLEDLKIRSNVVEGVISVGTGVTRAMRTLTKIMAGFRREYPNVRFSIVTQTAEAARYQLDRGLLDVCVMLEPVDLSDLSFIRFAEQETWSALVRADDPLCEKGFVTRKDLYKRELILPKRGQVVSELYSWLQKDPDELNIAYYNTLGGTASAIVYESGCVCLSVDGSNPFADETKIRSLPLSPAMQTTSVIAWKRTAVMTPAMEKFIEYLSCLPGMENS